MLGKRPFQNACVLRDVVAEQELGVTGDDLRRAEQRGIPTLALGRRFRHVHERWLVSSDRRVLDDPGAHLKADGSFVEAQLQRVPKHQVEQRGRCRSVVEAVLLLQGSDPLLGRVDEPVDVVTPCCVGADEIGLRQRAVVDDRAVEWGLAGAVDLGEQLGNLGIRVAERAKQRQRQLSREQAHEAEGEGDVQEGHLVDLVLEAVGTEGIELGGRRVQAENIEQHLVGVATSLADPADIGDEGSPVVFDLSQDAEQLCREGGGGTAILYAPEPGQAGEVGDGLNAVRLVTDSKGRKGAPPCDVSGEEGAGVADDCVGERRREEGVHEVAERRRPQSDLHRVAFAAIGLTRAGNSARQRLGDAETFGQPLAVAP